MEDESWTSSRTAPIVTEESETANLPNINTLEHTDSNNNLDNIILTGLQNIKKKLGISNPECYFVYDE